MMCVRCKTKFSEYDEYYQRYGKCPVCKKFIGTIVKK